MNLHVETHRDIEGDWIATVVETALDLTLWTSEPKAEKAAAGEAAFGWIARTVYQAVCGAPPPADEEKARPPDDFDYQREALRTESGDLAAIAARLAVADPTQRLLHAALGLASEAGEFADAIHRHVFYGQPLDFANLIEETGDLRWYTAIAASALGVTLDEIDRANIAKLRTRFPEAFTETAAAEANRDRAAERKALSA